MPPFERDLGIANPSVHLARFRRITQGNPGRNSEVFCRGISEPEKRGERPVSEWRPGEKSTIESAHTSPWEAWPLRNSLLTRLGIQNRIFLQISHNEWSKLGERLILLDVLKTSGAENGGQLSFPKDLAAVGNHFASRRPLS
jgi:hypothetical protein